MNASQLTDLQKITRNHLIETYPLLDITMASLTKIIEDRDSSREDKLRRIVEFNLSFSIVHYFILTSRNIGKLQEIDFAFMLLHLMNWYKIGKSSLK